MSSATTPAGRGVGQGSAAVPAHGEASRACELGLAGRPAVTPGTTLAVAREGRDEPRKPHETHPLATGIGDQDAAVRRERQAGRLDERGFGGREPIAQAIGRRAADDEDGEVAVRAQVQHLAQAAIGHQQPTFGVEGERLRRVEGGRGRGTEIPDRAGLEVPSAWPRSAASIRG